MIWKEHFKYIFIRQDISVVFRYKDIKRTCNITLCTQIYPACKRSYMFQVYIYIYMYVYNTNSFLKIFTGDKELFKGYQTNAPSPLKSPSYERTKKFKCPVHSCRVLEL